MEDLVFRAHRPTSSHGETHWAHVQIQDVFCVLSRKFHILNIVYTQIFDILCNPISSTGVLTMESQKQVLEKLRGAFRSGVTRPIQFRLTQLEAMMSLFEDNETQILEAMHKDLAKV